MANNRWCRIAACVFFCMALSASAASVQEADFVRVALEQLRDRLEQDDKGTLDEFVADVSTASGLSAAASRDSLVSLLRELKTHCKKSTALGEQLFALHGVLFSEREAKAYLVRVVDMAGDLLEKEENVGLEPLIAKAAGKSKLLKFQALDYTAALLVPFVGSPMAEEPAAEEGAVNAPTGTFKVLVRTRNSERLQASGVIKPGHRGSMVRTRILRYLRPLRVRRIDKRKRSLHCMSPFERPFWTSSNSSAASIGPRISHLSRTPAIPWITRQTGTHAARISTGDTSR